MQYIERRLFHDGKPVDSTMALAKKDFKYAGEAMAMSVIQGGQAPNFISPLIYRYLTGNLLVDDINSIPKKELCQKVHSTCIIIIVYTAT